MKRPQVTMPKWPAYLLAAVAAACAVPAITAPRPASHAPDTARLAGKVISPIAAARIEKKAR